MLLLDQPVVKTDLPPVRRPSSALIHAGSRLPGIVRSAASALLGCLRHCTNPGSCSTRAVPGRGKDQEHPFSDANGPRLSAERLGKRQFDAKLVGGEDGQTATPAPHRSFHLSFLLAALHLALLSPALADQQPQAIKGIVFARIGEDQLKLDLLLPAGMRKHPLVVWVHGGAWRSGSRERVPIVGLVQAGYAVASIDYRLSPVAAFPAQAHDIKAALRYLRANASRYGYDGRRIAIAGASAGGHLAALVGTTSGNPDLEGRIGDHLDQSSDVAAIVDYYGPTNFLTILQQSTPHGLGVRIPALQLLLRGQPEDKPELARLASPVFHVDAGDPPLLLVHGDQDPQVPINQSHELHGRYEELGLPVQFEVVHGGAHGGPQFFDGRRLDLVKLFLDQHLREAERADEAEPKPR